MQGGFFLMKNPLSIAASVNSRSKNAGTDALLSKALSPNLFCFDFRFDLVGASLLSVFLTGPGETIRDKSDVAAYCGEPPAKRHPSLKANRISQVRYGGEGISVDGPDLLFGCRQNA